MGKLSDFLTGIIVLEEVESPINGTIKVIKSLAFGTYIQVGNLTQSGGIIYEVWKKPLKKISNFQFPISNVLILGLGGGTVVKLVKKFWPEAKVVGIDIDPIMVELGKKYLGLDKLDTDTKIEDAYEYVRIISKNKRKFDLILVDLYVGDEFPGKFESENYIHLVGSVLASDGVAVFNRLYYGEKRPQAVKFGKKLEKFFSNVDVIYPEANIMFICST